MNTWQKLMASGLIVAITGVLRAQLSTETTTQNDSIVQITAEAAGLTRIDPATIPPTASCWWTVYPNAGPVPLPCPPPDLSVPIYSIADGIYLVDQTGGARNGTQGMSSSVVTATATMQGNAVANLIEQVQGTQMLFASGSSTMSMDSLSVPVPGDTNTDSGGYDGYALTNYSNFSFDTNLLWLQITNVFDATAYAGLHNGTNQVYVIWSTPDLAIPFPGWQVETEVFPTSATSNTLPFTFPTAGRQNLFLRAQDWTGVYTNGLPCWWTWYYFHTLNLLWSDLDANGNTLGYDFTNHYEPNLISFKIITTNVYVNIANPSLSLDILNGVPGNAAVLVNDANYSHATWLPYNGNNVFAPLGADGNYSVSVGLRGFVTNATVSWQTINLIKDTVAPQLTVTNPIDSAITHTPIQVSGYANEPLGTISFDLTNAAGTFTNQTGFLTGLAFDTNRQVFTTNFFQFDDLDLANGANFITIHATDWAGNSTNVSVSLNYSASTNPPVVSIVWPTSGMSIAASTLTMQVKLDSATTTISASTGSTMIQGVVERNGTAWIQNVPLNSDSNPITLTATDASGHSTVTNVTVIRNDVGLMISPLPSNELNQPTVTVNGSIGDASLQVYVNGVAATVNSSDGTWQATDVPVSVTGTALLDAEVYAGGSTPIASQMLSQPQPVMVTLMSYFGHQSALSGGATFFGEVNWSYKSGGRINDLTGVVDDIEPSTNGITYATGATSVDPFIFDPVWEYASVSTPVPGYIDLFQCFTQTRVMIAPGGQTQAGQTNTYLVLANAREFSSIGGTTYDEILWIPYYYGDTPLPPEWLQINGRNLINSGQTNILASVSDDIWGATIVSGPAGKNLDVTPVATRVYHNWDYTFDARAYQVSLKILDANTMQDLTLQTNTVIVGQQMNLICQLSITNSFMTNFVLTNFSWTVPGQTVRQAIQYFSYDSNDLAVTYGTNSLLQRSDLQSNNIAFYWIDGGTNIEVDCTGTVAGMPIMGKAIFNVLRPSSTFAAITTTIVPPVNINTNPEFNGILLQYGLPSMTAGMEGIFFNFSVTTPTNGAGSFGFLQVINSTLRRYISDTGLAQKRAGTNCLDHTFGPIVIGQTTVGNAGTNSATFQDSPGDILKSPSVSRLWVSASDSFSSYLLYRPAGNTNQTIWVTLRKINWNWSGAATNVTGNWILQSGYPSPPVNPVSTNTSELPTWSGEFLGLPIVPDN